ncbi:DNA-protecting protein DprA [Natronospirillum operosum]|uniref:DNA-protecting protein DprA n=1 Tax=Natronospirillum operosum TaxID=2759953 RepID=A0A4Z0W469_9GAMM|nr:DNA-processing protein DprA [Natronospirillum operosum]TGG91492.1 DNA-protecting protein DprA [Natronospirillum operosum]
MTIDRDQLPWLVLHLTPGLTGRRLQQLLMHHGSPRALEHLTPSALQAMGWPRLLAQAVLFNLQDPWQALPDLKRVANWAARPGNQLLTPGDADFPAALMDILPDPPPVLYVQGSAPLLSQPQLAVVGSRHPQASSRQLAHDWSRALAAAGLPITSGLARGIDAAAHQGALDAAGQTIAVIGSGLDDLYPAGHEALAAQIVDQHGAVISELPPWAPPKAANFPRRNRLVAALARAVLVVEAAERSGSLITARLAGEFGRDVLAVPGHPFAPGAAGTNALLRDGAMVADHWSVALDLYPEYQGGTQGETPGGPALSEDQARVFAAVGTLPTALETLALTLDCEPESLYEPLLELELAGLIGVQGGSYVRLQGP